MYMHVHVYIHECVYTCMYVFVCACVCVNVPSYYFSIACSCSACLSPLHLLESRQMSFPPGHLLRLSGLISQPIAHRASSAC